MTGRCGTRQGSLPGPRSRSRSYPRAPATSWLPASGSVACALPGTPYSSVSRGRSISAWPNGDTWARSDPTATACSSSRPGPGSMRASWRPPTRTGSGGCAFGAYIGATVRELLRLAPIELNITADGERLERTGHLALVANTGTAHPGPAWATPADRSERRPTGSCWSWAAEGSQAACEVPPTSCCEAGARGDDDPAHDPRGPHRDHPPQPIEIDGDLHPAGWLAPASLPTR